MQPAPLQIPQQLIVNKAATWRRVMHLFARPTTIDDERAREQ
jgi:hypothetical protein